ncbi:unnamed protein product [Lupinus luteus]|uniref:Uncharacterized protein n=1 Tax=Lupinus luteus TaxID=3873 RepID=A0AAV1YKA7_LUPLU
MTPKSVLPESMKYSARARGDSPRSSSTSSLWSLRIQAVGKLIPNDLRRLSNHMSPPQMRNQNNEKEPTKDVEMDDEKARNPVKDTSDDLIFDLETTDESDRIINDQGKSDKPEKMEEVEVVVSPRPLQPQSPKPSETYTLLQNAIEPLTSSPPLPPTPQNVAMPPAAAKFQQSAIEVTMLSLPPLRLSPGSSLATAAPPPMSLKDGSASAPPPPMSLKDGSTSAPPPPMSLKDGSTSAPPPPMSLNDGSVSAPSPPISLKNGSTSAPPPPPMSLKNGSTSAPPPPPMSLRNGSTSAPPPPLIPSGNRGAAPPPPPTNDMTKLVKFHRDVESILENLTDESQERRNDAAKRDSGSNINDAKRKECVKLLWRAFQFAFKVYTFAGGHDDRADNLATELAKEIDNDPNHQ